MVPDGNDTQDLACAIREAQAEDQRPSLVLARTHIGYGSPLKQDNFSAHGEPLGEEELQATKKALGWPSMEKFTYLMTRWSFFAERSLSVLSLKNSGGKAWTHISKPFRRKPPNSRAS